MEKKVIKYWSDIFKQEITMTIDERLNKVDEKKIAPQKQEIANKQLEKINDFLQKH
jgi:hypothetical protein